VSSPDKAIDSKDRAIPGSHSALYDRRASARSIRSIAFAAKARQKTASATITPPPEVAAVGETTTPERCDSLETAAAVIAEAQAGLSLSRAKLAAKTLAARALVILPPEVGRNRGR